MRVPEFVEILVRKLGRRHIYQPWMFADESDECNLHNLPEFMLRANLRFLILGLRERSPTLYQASSRISLGLPASAAACASACFFQ